MVKKLRIVILKDQNIDAELIELKLRKREVSFISTYVETKEDFLREIKVFVPDLIVSTYKLSSHGSSILKIAREKCPGVPFIFL